MAPYVNVVNVVQFIRAMPSIVLLYSLLHLKRNLEISNTDAEKCWALLALRLQTVIAMPRTLPGRGTDNAGEVSCLDEAV
jgi:hypothetical protein